MQNSLYIVILGLINERMIGMRIKNETDDGTQHSTLMYMYVNTAHPCTCM